MPCNNPNPDAHGVPDQAGNRAALYSSATSEWPTPTDFFAALDAEFGFVLDVCASTTNHKASAFYALDHPDESRRDGLGADWAAETTRLGGAAWMNPPYGRPIGAWMAKAAAAAQAGATVVTLVPVRADTAWWHEHVLVTGAEVRYVRGRLTFGDAVNTAAFASAVVIYRPTDIAGAPGPVGTMPNHPVVPAAMAAATAAPPAPETSPAPGTVTALAARAHVRATATGRPTPRRVPPRRHQLCTRNPASPTRSGQPVDSSRRKSHNHKTIEHLFDCASPSIPATDRVLGAHHV